MKRYDRKCLNCKVKYQPKQPNQVVCGVKCSVEYTAKKSQKERTKEKKEAKEKLKTKGDHLKELQKVFNEFIRLRDKDKPCISCGKPLIGKYDAGHAFSVGAYPNLRFDEFNCFGQCVACNQHRHGNISEYMIMLPLRIGQEAFDDLLFRRTEKLHLSIEEIKELKSLYKKKVKELKNTKL